MVAHSPPPSREAFMNEVDALIDQLEEAHQRATHADATRQAA
jgi:hypothetical protein